MTHTFKLARRAARFRAPLLTTLLALAFGACDSAQQLTNTTTDQPTDPTTVAPAANPDQLLEDSLAVEDSLATAADPTGGLAIVDDDPSPIGEEVETMGADVVSAGQPAFSAAVAGVSLAAAALNRRGIPYGTFHLPREIYGRGFNGSISNISPYLLIAHLQAARRTGTRVILTFSGNERTFKNANRSFSITKWKARVNRFRRLNLTPYINDGTIVAHYLMDEPNDPTNWGGRLVSRATLDAIARYSKQLWPNLPTVVRSSPAYLKGYNYRYLDAAWSQYAARFGSVTPWLNGKVRDAKAARLALVVGLNQIAGGTSSGLRGYYTNRYAFRASQLRSVGAAILANPYPCAFLNWRYDARYMGRADVRAALAYLAVKARAKPRKSCRGS